MHGVLLPAVTLSTRKDMLPTVESQAVDFWRTSLILLHIYHSSPGIVNAWIPGGRQLLRTLNLRSGSTDAGHNIPQTKRILSLKVKSCTVLIFNITSPKVEHRFTPLSYLPTLLLYSYIVCILCFLNQSLSPCLDPQLLLYVISRYTLALHFHHKCSQFR